MVKNGVDNFLQSQAQEGEFESSREFSVNLFAAHQKMGRYALPRNSAWLLKFVQAATELNSPHLDIKLNRAEVSITYPSGLLGDIAELENRLNTLMPSSLAEDHLFGGILALHSLPGELSIVQDDKVWHPLSDQEIQDSAELQEGLKVVYRPEKGGFWAALRARLWFTSGLLTELEENCYACPVDLRVDAKSLTHGERDIPLISGLISGKKGEELDLYGQLSRDTGKRTVYCNWGSNRPTTIGYAVQIRVTPQRSPSTLSLEWIRSGVVVKKSVLEQTNGRQLIARILIPTRGLHFDATGFAIRDNDESKNRAAFGATYLEHAVEAVMGELAREDRWNRFLRKRKENPSVPRVDDLLDQLLSFIDSGKRYFSKEFA